MKLQSNTKHVLFFAFCAAVMVVPVSVMALSLDLALDNTLYSFEERFNPASKRFNYYGAYDFAAQNLGLAGLSVYSNVAVTSGFTDPLRKEFNARTLFVEARDLFHALDVRVGRQHLYRVESKTAYLDGIDLVFRSGDLLRVNAYGGLSVPSQYSRMVIDNKDYSLGGSVNVHIMNALWLGVCASDKFDTLGSVLRVGANASGRVASVFDLNGLALYNTTESLLEEYNVKLGVRVMPQLNVTAFVLGEQGTIDSTNPFMAILRTPHTDVGLRVRAGSRATSVEVHYVLRNDSAGMDNLIGLDGSFAGVCAGYEVGIGKRGSSHNGYLAYTRQVTPHCELGARVEGDFNRNADSLAWNNNVFAVVHTAFIVPDLRLRISPEFQFITNKYYNTDYRLLLNVNYTLSGFFKS